MIRLTDTPHYEGAMSVEGELQGLLIGTLEPPDPGSAGAAAARELHGLESTTER